MLRCVRQAIFSPQVGLLARRWKRSTCRLAKCADSAAATNLREAPRAERWKRASALLKLVRASLHVALRQRFAQVSFCKLRFCAGMRFTCYFRTEKLVIFQPELQARSTLALQACICYFCTSNLLFPRVTRAVTQTTRPLDPLARSRFGLRVAKS